MAFGAMAWLRPQGPARLMDCPSDIARSMPPGAQRARTRGQPPVARCQSDSAGENALPGDQPSGRQVWSGLLTAVMTHFWFKCLGTLAFLSLFFPAYVYLLKKPASNVFVMPITLADRLVGFEPLALPIYLSLWLYVSLPVMLMLRRADIIRFGGWIGGLCLMGLAIFYYWPNAVPPANIDWARYPGVAFLKGVDAAGNACPSLHVASAAFSAYWLHWQLGAAGLGRRSRLLNIAWCLAIAYSTMATKQHVAVDVIAGAALGLAWAWWSRPMRKLALA